MGLPAFSSSACVKQVKQASTSKLKLSDYSKLFEENVMIVIGRDATKTERETAEGIAVQLRELTGNELVIKSDAAVSEKDKTSYNLILIGTPNFNSLLTESYKLTSMKIVTEEWPGKNKGVLEILRNPWNSAKALLIVTGSNEIGLKAATVKLNQHRELRGSSMVVGPNTIKIPKSNVIVAPKELLMHIGQRETLDFWNHKIVAHYVSSSPMQILRIVIDEEEGVIEIDPNLKCPNHHCARYWYKDNLSFSLRPINWRTLKATDEKVWSYSKTWKTSDLYFKVAVIKSFLKNKEGE